LELWKRSCFGWWLGMNIFQDFDWNHQRLDKPISPLKILKPMILGLMGFSTLFLRDDDWNRSKYQPKLRYLFMMCFYERLSHNNPLDIPIPSQQLRFGAMEP
jgi:hypothetical protein